MASCSPVQGCLGLPRNGTVPILIGRCEPVRPALPYAPDAPRDCRMCEVGVKRNKGQSTLALRPPVRSNSNVAALRALTAASKHGIERPLSAVLTPLPWFLRGPMCIRGGLARHFASAWLFHRGIHLEASLAWLEIKVTHYQRVGPRNRRPKSGF